MAFNLQTFKTRALTAIIFAAVMLFGLLWNRWTFFVLISTIHFGCWWEYFKLLEKIHNRRYHIYIKLGLMLLGFGLLLWFANPLFSLFNYGLSANFSLPVSLAGFIILIIGIFQKQAIEIRSFLAAMLGLLYISLSWGLMINFYRTDLIFHFYDTVFVVGPIMIPILIIASIWINDTMAYIVGSFIGKRPLSPISPKKTWEGTIGGIILCVVVMVFVLPLSIGEHWQAAIGFTGPIALIAGITGTLGDLFESKLKRLAAVKDSGNIMPGHGGFLDRFDSLLFAIPAVWLFIKFFFPQYDFGPLLPG